MVRKCKTNFLSSRRKPDIDSFSTSGDIWARRWLRCHDLVSPGEKVDEKNFFCQTILNGPIRKKKTLFQKFEKFLPLWPDPGSTLRKFSQDFFKKHNGSFIEIGVSDRLDIVYSECFWTLKLILINSTPVKVVLHTFL